METLRSETCPSIEGFLEAPGGMGWRDCSVDASQSVQGLLPSVQRWVFRACKKACRELSEREVPSKAVSVTFVVVAVVKYLGVHVFLMD